MKKISLSASILAAAMLGAAPYGNEFYYPRGYPDPYIPREGRARYKTLNLRPTEGPIIDSTKESKRAKRRRLARGE